MAKVDQDVQALFETFKKLRKRKLNLLKNGNPKKMGTPTRARWNQLLRHAKKGGKVGDYLTGGGNPETLRNAVYSGYVEVH